MSSKNNYLADQYVGVQIIDDSDDEVGQPVKNFNEEEEEMVIEVEVTNKKKRIAKPKKEAKEVKVKEPKVKKVKQIISKATISEATISEATISEVPNCLLKKYYSEFGTLEIGADEVGRGPMLGRVYSAAVILPKDDSFDHFKMKDSKKFVSKNPKKIQEVSEYIKEHAIAWAIEYEDEKVIDEINKLEIKEIEF